MRPHFTSQFINRGYSTFPYRLDVEEAHSLTSLLRFYNPIGGPIRKVALQLSPMGALPMAVAHSAFYDIDHVLRAVAPNVSATTSHVSSVPGGGKGATPFSAFISAMGEAVERGVGMLEFFHLDSIRGTFEQLTRQGYHCLSPNEMPLFSADQYEQPHFMYRPFGENTVLTWILGRRLLSHQEIWVPAQLVALYFNPHPDEEKIGYSTSGGLTCHVSYERAVLHGVCELIERDAINLCWYLDIPPKHVQITKVPSNGTLNATWEAMRELPKDFYVLYHSLDMPEIPVITVITIDSWFNRLSFNAGGGAAIDGQEALLKALNEYGQSEASTRMALFAPRRPMGTNVRLMCDADPNASKEAINQFIQAVGYYGYPQNHDKLTSYLRDGADIALTALPNVSGSWSAQFVHLRNILQRYHLDPIVFDLTAEERSHVTLVKVFIPELTQPFVQARPMFGHPRFFHIASRFGHNQSSQSSLHFTEDPLPYP